jgi:hypothetical protein
MIKNPPRKFMTGYRPAVYAREGLVWGMRNPFDGPVFERLEEAEEWCIDVIIEHHYRGLGMSDAEIRPFKGMVDCYRPGPPERLRDIERICREIAEKRKGQSKL